MSGNKPCLPDTNVILRYLLNDVPEEYRQAFEFFEKVREGKSKAWITEGVLVEVVYVLLKYYEIPRAEISSSLCGLLSYKGIINPDSDIFISAVRLYEKNSLDIVDCLLAARSAKDGRELFTFDKKLKGLSGKPSVPKAS